MKILVTGAAGFIGSHLSDRLLREGHEVVGVDNLSAGFLRNIPKHNKFKFRMHDVRDERKMLESCRGIELIFHLAADPLVKESAERPVASFDINVRGTLSVLEAARRTSVEGFVFASTSAVYGDARIFPTPELHPSIPISNYAASKIAAEAYISAYSSTYGFRGTVLRYANIFGPRSEHGVMHDFYFKLKRKPKELLILGNGKQAKSYLYISDCIDATVAAYRKQKPSFDFYNVGSDRMYTVNEIADVVSKDMKLSPKYSYTGGVRGWVGDVNKMRLDVRKLKNLTGWKPKVSFKHGVKLYLEWLGTRKG
ncbi:MAG: GDP-mannose 4,6-dehydratase [Candidatus Micrarchaeota archaeon]